MSGRVQGMARRHPGADRGRGSRRLQRPVCRRPEHPYRRLRTGRRCVFPDHRLARVLTSPAETRTRHIGLGSLGHFGARRFG